MTGVHVTVESNRDIHERMDMRFDAVLHEIAELRERMAKMEGSLEGFPGKPPRPRRGMTPLVESRGA